MAVGAKTSPNAGLLSILPESTNIVTYPKAACLRPYVPSKLSRYGSGIVQWSSDNPALNGYSVKDELT
jgi:hypothetical protein